MSERKAINKYYPADFDPSKIKKVKKKVNGIQQTLPTVRLMIPFSMKCLQCNEYIAKSRKFNARKEISNQDYLGIKIIQFYIRCPRCFAMLVFKTDPKNGDFECVSGCKKNFEKSKNLKKEETVEQMITRLEEEARLEEIDKKNEKNGHKNKIISDSNETALEQLEKRLVKQQKEKEMMDEIEDLQAKNIKLESLKNKVDKKVDNDLELKYSNEAEQAFKNYRDKFYKSSVDIAINKDKKPPLSVSILEGYSSSDEDNEEEVTDKIIIKKRKSELNGIIKRKKPKIIM